ncbi:Lpg1974 family pore-forming outer membrane protein [Allorhodopirellula heiligendammensis]|uniref:Phosphate-selective porin O and P n=1 Tax=Allorhodopirellula heiligendammensis TaxID=2714739 RepID=A0A5C6C004_9BACT|nr:Lpg1974 family pore-forming outer membrane protein [Allorhodopirellula heiligendammensis]TWU16836.1 hypothetical protein Poly21_40430 [Allorhodopirellula heiligendammensis]
MPIRLRRWLAAGALLTCCGSVLAENVAGASYGSIRSDQSAPANGSIPRSELTDEGGAKAGSVSCSERPPRFSFFPDQDLDVPASLVGYQSQSGVRIASESGVEYRTSINRCCVPPWVHQSVAFGEVLVMRARNADTAYAAPVDGTVPAGSTGVLSSEFDFGYRVGLIKALDRCHSIVATYTGFISENDDQIAGAALSKLLIHPDAINAASNALTASGRTELDFHVFDLDYRFLLHGSDSSAINMIIGARYAHMEQEIGAIYQPVGIVDAVSSDVDFDGAGLRLGLDAQHFVGHGLYGYGKANASFLAGEFDASYLNTRDGAYVSSSNFTAARLVTILDLEVGAGWQASENFRVSTGYSVSGWFNSITTADWIDGVRDNNNHFADMSQAITFDGFNARVEIRF